MSGLEETAASRLTAALTAATAAATAATTAVTNAVTGQPPPPGKIYKFCIRELPSHNDIRRFLAILYLPNLIQFRPIWKKVPIQ